MKRITIREVAARAGVSLMTVSRVINNGTNVQPQTRARVQAAIEALNFRPSQSARSLRHRRANWISLAYQKTGARLSENPPGYLIDFQAGIMSRCHQDGYHLFMHMCDPEDPRLEQDLLGAAVSDRPDGILLVPPLSLSKKLLRELHNLNIPLVRIGAAEGDDDSPCVDVDDRAAARQLTEYLIGLGHRHIGFITGHPEHRASALRLAGYREALHAAGLRASEQDVVQGFFDMDSGIAAARKLLSRKRRPTAIFASNDEMAAGCLAVAHDAGLAVPAQLSVAGFDDTYVAQMVWPPLTTVRQPIYDIGFTAAHQLFTVLQGGRAASKVMLSYRVIERATTAQPTTRG